MTQVIIYDNLNTMLDTLVGRSISMIRETRTSFRTIVTAYDRRWSKIYRWEGEYIDVDPECVRSFIEIYGFAAAHSTKPWTPEEVDRVRAIFEPEAVHA